jgi:MATE family multidrug resistance protein
VLGRYALARLFFGSGETSEVTVELTATLLLVGATFFIADGLQTIMGGALRGLNDTRMTLLFAIIGYWCVGFPTAWVLAFNAGLGAIGVWIGLSLGTYVYAALLILRFRKLARRLSP